MSLCHDLEYVEAYFTAVQVAMTRLCVDSHWGGIVKYKNVDLERVLFFLLKKYTR